MGEKVDLALANPDDVQSANALFNFVGRLDYLVESLEKKALVPRYCEEDIGYLKNVLIAKSNDKLSLSGVDIILNNKIMEELWKKYFYLLEIYLKKVVFIM